MENLNDYVISFIKKMDFRKSKETHVNEWIEYSKSINTSVDTKSKKKTKRKNPYLFFADDMRDVIKQTHPDLTSNKDVLGKIGEEWAKLKELNNDQYKKYLQMSLDYAKDEDEIVYQVTKPFHKFSLDKRGGLEHENPQLSSTEITELLVKQWRSLTRTEKDKWEI